MARNGVERECFSIFRITGEGSSGGPGPGDKIPVNKIRGRAYSPNFLSHFFVVLAIPFTL